MKRLIQTKSTDNWGIQKGFYFQLIYVDERKSSQVNSLSLSISSPAPHISLFALLPYTLSFCSLPLPPPPPLPVVCWAAHRGQRRDKLTNRKVVQHKVRGHRSADSLSNGKSRATGQWFHTLEILTPLSFYRKLNWDSFKSELGGTFGILQCYWFI